MRFEHVFLSARHLWPSPFVRWQGGLIYGHPQAPTGMRAIAELVEALRARGGGIGAFTGCAAGDTGAALVLAVE